MCYTIAHIRNIYIARILYTKNKRENPDSFLQVPENV